MVLREIGCLVLLARLWRVGALARVLQVAVCSWAQSSAGPLHAEHCSWEG